MTLHSNPLMASRKRERAGFTIIYILILWTVLVGFVSLSVDWGRVQLIKTELQGAADAATRAAAVNLSQGITATQNAAVTWAGYNTADGTSVIIDPNNDVEFGNWDFQSRTFTILSGASRSSANAVRVTARRTAANGNAVKLWFASLIGQSTIDIKASAIAGNGNGGPSVVGLSLLDTNSNSVDSYNSASGAYTTFPQNSNARCASNGSIDCQNSIIKGDCHPGVGRTITNSGNVSGSKTPLTTALSYPTPTAGGAATTNNNANLPGAYFNSSTRNLSIPSINITIPGGTYYVNNMDWGNATINFSGPAVFYVTGIVTQHNNYVTSYQNRPANLQINVTTSASVQIDCDQILNASIYAPLSTVSIVGLADTCGSVIANSLNLRRPFHVDESLNGSGAGGAVTTVK